MLLHPQPCPRHEADAGLARDATAAATSTAPTSVRSFMVFPPVGRPFSAIHDQTGTKDVPKIRARGCSRAPYRDDTEQLCILAAEMEAPAHHTFAQGRCF